MRPAWVHVRAEQYLEGAARVAPGTHDRLLGALRTLVMSTRLRLAEDARALARLPEAAELYIAYAEAVRGPRTTPAPARGGAPGAAVKGGSGNAAATTKGLAARMEGRIEDVSFALHAAAKLGLGLERPNIVRRAIDVATSLALDQSAIWPPTVTLRLAALLVQQKSWDDAITAIERSKLHERSGSPALQMWALAVWARALEGRADHAGATQRFQALLDIATATHASAEKDATLSAEVVATTETMGEAYHHLIRRHQQAAEAIALPTFPGVDPRAQPAFFVRIDAWAKRQLREIALAEKRLAIARLPRASPVWAARSAAVVAAMWSHLISKLEGSLYPKTRRHLDAARRAHVRCANHSVADAILINETIACRRWLYTQFGHGHGSIDLLHDALLRRPAWIPPRSTAP